MTVKNRVSAVSLTLRNRMVITQDILNQGLSKNGSYGYKQLKALGLPDNYFKNKQLKKGWKWFLMGLDVPDEQIIRFFELKDAHLKQRDKTGKLFE